MEDREVIATLEHADTATFARLLLRPTVAEERIYRTYFGDERYERLHGLALSQNRLRGTLTPPANVVILPGIMGSMLDALPKNGGSHTVWVHIFRLLRGAMGELALASNGQSNADPNLTITASGYLKRFYGETELMLARNAAVRVFWYDWRKSLDLAAADLDFQLRKWFPNNEKVFLVAHSMGGLVSRTFCANYPEHWQQKIARLIMLGTPNFGAPAITQVLTGLEETNRMLAFADLIHTPAEMQAIMNSFPGIYQMLPSPILKPHLKPLYDASNYGRLPLSQLHLDAALRHHAKLDKVFDADRMSYIAGYNQITISDIPTPDDGLWLTNSTAYQATRNGDNRVPHDFGVPYKDGKPTIPVYFVEDSHGRLPVNDRVLDAVNDLIHTGATSALPQRISGVRGDEKGLTGADVIRETYPNPAEIEALVRSVRGSFEQEEKRGRRGEGEKNLSLPTPLSADERKLEDFLLSGFLGDHPTTVQDNAQSTRPEPRKITLEIGIVRANLQDVHHAEHGLALPHLRPDVKFPLDVIAVGHYLGVKPQTAELALDRAISSAVPGGTVIAREDLLVTQLSERGIIRGDLAQPFLLPDPRPKSDPNSPDRLLAFVGMGVIGRFGTPELIVTVRELCWTLGRLGKHHLATVVIGSGFNNIPLRDSLAGWLEGAKQALTSAASQNKGQNRNALTRITFVECNPARILEIDATLQTEIARVARETDPNILFEVRYKPLAPQDRVALETLKLTPEPRDLRERESEVKDDPTLQPARLTVSMDTRGYRFGAITGNASIPERDIAVDAKLIMDANLELAAEMDREQQKEKGLFLERLLIPDDFQSHLQSPAPVVLMLDATTARIHWEMMAQADISLEPNANANLRVSDFLGTSRGLTRQLRTAFAPPPEPPPPPTRTLRVLIVADPAEDAHLPGAEEEGFALEELFRKFNAQFMETTGNHIEIVRLSGPYQAKRTTVLRHLMLRTYDVLHFAGHCIYDAAEPIRSGWIFTGGERLTANELTRIDRIPRFVFSNACESGVTPERPDLRSEALAPSFAESFFARGVSNFVCTAWSVDDLASLEFAEVLYGSLLGLIEEGEKGRGGERENLDQNSSRLPDNKTSVSPSLSLPFSPSFMHAAMRDARRAVFKMANGARSWGAYQHYGNPYLRLFSPRALDEDETKPQSRNKPKK